jgi:serine/threonine protein kinase
MSSDEYSSDKEEPDTINIKNNFINDYNIIKYIGKGSHCSVCLVYDISDNNYYAMKIYNLDSYDDALNEINITYKIPTEPKIFNNIKKYFIEIINNKKYIFSIWYLHYGSLYDYLQNKNKLTIENINYIMKQLIEGLDILHNKLKIYHGDLKPENILLKGYNNNIKTLIDIYNKYNFLEKYKEEKNKYKNLKKEMKYNIRNKLHTEILNNVLQEYEKINIDKSYIGNFDISICDFESCSNLNDIHTSQFGTRYYMAPEIILMGKCNEKVDIWALGCLYYELLTKGDILFNPMKDKFGTRDYYHLKLIYYTCGEYPIEFITKTKYYNKYFKNNKLINLDNTIYNRLDEKLRLYNILNYKEILINMLNIDPYKRININQLKTIFQN